MLHDNIYHSLYTRMCVFTQYHLTLPCYSNKGHEWTFDLSHVECPKDVQKGDYPLAAYYINTVVIVHAAVDGKP